MSTAAPTTNHGANPEGWQAQLRDSFRDSVGEIVFGMEDGTVSIFGLVFGVAASAPNAHTVLLAGATGAVAAAVSMMAGTYLDVESDNDRRDAAVADRQRAVADDPEARFRSEISRLTDAGFATEEIDTITSILRRHPDTADALDQAFGLGIAPTKAQRPAVQAAWMFVADLLAAFTPVLPFAWFTHGTARMVSLIVTVLLLVALGIGRARIGKKPVLATTFETIAIAAGAAGAGVLVARLIS
jgi:VIT1/CCC1 family predicted Fe2+/Mn2+ transporter